MTTDFQTALQSGGAECQNLGAVNSFEGQKGSSQLQAEDLIRVVTCKIVCFTLLCEIHGIHSMESFEKYFVSRL